MKKTIKQNAALTLASLLFCGLLLCLFEVFTRVAYPTINHQDTQSSLFRENAFGTSLGWQPNARGISFGVEVTIDELGFRKMDAPVTYEESWLLLGDSVPFGVGIETQHTLPQLLQNEFPSVKLWNTTVVGYSLSNYKDVLNHFLKTRNDITKILLFFCLNDIYGHLKIKPVPQTPMEKTLSFLRRKSKFYMLLKNALSDRSKTYFLHDQSLYEESGKQFRDAMVVISELNDKLTKRGIDFIIIILPYEYPLREKDRQLNRPQQLIAHALRESNIDFINVYDHVAKTGEESTDLYLYADAMHFSKIGHQHIFEIVRQALR